jgi:hypothetical protein
LRTTNSKSWMRCVPQTSLRLYLGMFLGWASKKPDSKISDPNLARPDHWG